jgi:hypothetical protein
MSSVARPRTMLMHADDRRVDHLYRSVVGASQRIHDPAPNASPPPANEAIVAGGIGVLVPCDYIICGLHRVSRVLTALAMAEQRMAAAKSVRALYRGSPKVLA